MTQLARLRSERDRLAEKLERTPPRSTRRQVVLADLARVTTRLIKAEIRPSRPAATKETRP